MAYPRTLCWRPRLAIALAAAPAGVAPQAPQQQQQQQQTEDDRWVDARLRFSLRPPAAWRMLEPTEGHELEQRGVDVPAELLRPAPPNLYTFGPVERWQRAGTRFDGRALQVVVIDGEPELDEVGLDEIRRYFQRLSATGAPRIEVDTAKLVEFGAEGHRGLEFRLRVGDGEQRFDRIDLYAPTAGSTVILSLRWPAGDAAAEDAVWSRLVDSLRLARPPRGPSHLASKLFYAALAGIGIGLLFHVIRRRRR